MTQGIIADPDATERAASLKDTSLPADKASISAQAQELAARTQAASTTATEQRRASLNITEPPIDYPDGMPVPEGSFPKGIRPERTG